MTHKNFNTNRVMRWRLIIEEYGPDIKYIEGPKNVVADALSRLDMEPEKPQFKSKLEQCLFYEEQILNTVTVPDKEMPISYPHIQAHQDKDRALKKTLLTNKSYHIKNFHGAGILGNTGKSWDLICNHDKIVIPDSLKMKVLEWYHIQLVHPGRDRTLKTISQHFYWKGMHKDVEQYCKKCPKCQLTKSKKNKYGHLPPKEAEAIPWQKLCVDLIGPYNIPVKYNKSKKIETLWCVTMIDPATSWFEMKQITDKTAITVANIVEQNWLSRYPWPQEITYDRGTEFMKEFAEMVKEDYGITKKPCSARNPQSNSVLERVHLVVGNMIKTFQIYNREDLDEEDPWSGILSAVMFAVRNSYNSSLEATPTQ